MIRFLLHLAAIVLFLVAALFGDEVIRGVSIAALDWIALGLACWAASSLGPPPSRG